MGGTEERAQFRPGRALAQGLTHMFDFLGVLSQNKPDRSVEEDLAQAWSDVLSVVRPPPREPQQ